MRERFHAFPRAFTTAAAAASADAATKSLANHRMPSRPVNPRTDSAHPGFSCSRGFVPCLDAFTHANTPSRRRSARLSGARDCIIEGCKSRVDGMPSWLRNVGGGW